MSETLLEPEGRVLPTLERDGRRRWLMPRLAKGAFYRRRRAVAYALIGLLVALPMVSINGKPAVLLDVPARRFTLFGYTFLPTDTVMLAMLLVAGFAAIFLVTALLGRVWCGWACPHTVFLEFVFRPVERLCLGRAGVGGAPRGKVAGWRYAAMHALFLLLSLGVTHTLLSYFVGVAQLRVWITGNPAEHPAAFVLIVASTAAVLFNFAIFREQMCSIACPYGRFQSVMLDRRTLAVRYDLLRGEPRGRATRSSLRQLEAAPRRDACVADGVCEKCGKVCPGTGEAVADLVAVQAVARGSPDPAPAGGAAGDCVDCSMCVQVCPAGIDIRDGTQLECVNCTQCIDACDAVMTKLGRPTGLIGYHSLASLESRRPTRWLRPRVVIYSTLALAFATALIVLMLTKKPFDAVLSRNGGLPFFVDPAGRVENTMRLTIRNRVDAAGAYTVRSLTPGVAVAQSGEPFDVAAQASAVFPIRLVADADAFADVDKRRVTLHVADARGHVRTLDCEVFGPAGGRQ